MTPALCPGRLPARRRPQRGGAALLVTVVLFFVMTLIAGVANRNHLFELRVSANQVRAAQAFEAAEAGADWAIAMLNGLQPLDAQCAAVASGGTPFRTRFLSADASSGALTPVTWGSGTGAMPQQAACVREAGGWACSCPAGAPPTPVPAAAAPAGMAPAFIVHFEPGPSPGTVRLRSTGCSALAGDCLPGSTTPPDATARVELTLGLLPGLARLPAAALTVRGAVSAGSASVGFHHPDPRAGGVAVHAGGSVSAPQARVTGAPGAAAAQAIVDDDEWLAALGPDALFAATFGLDKALWRQQAGVAQLACDGECSAALSQALSGSAQPRMVWIAGSPQFSAPLAIGTPDRPVIVVSSGPMRLVGPVVLHGLVHAASLEWVAGAGAGAPLLRGAALSEGGYQGSAAADFFRDAAVLGRLKAETGSFARVPGSWKDF